MSRLNQAQIADLAERCQRILTLMRTTLRHRTTDPRDFGKSMGNELHQLAVKHGKPGISFAVRAWVDAVIAATPQPRLGAPTDIAFTTPDRTAVIPTAAVDRERRWAAAVLAARFSDDQLRVYHLIESLPGGARTLVYLYAVVEMTAGILNDYDKPGDGPIKTGMWTQDDTGRFHHITAES